MADRPIDIPDPEIPGIPEPDSLASKEVEAFSKHKEWTLRSIKYEWSFRFALRFSLFIFVLGLNWWWCRNVLEMVWKAGLDKSGFHLDNSVLIALVSTSIANFLALVLVVARHLFPSSK